MAREPEQGTYEKILSRMGMLLGGIGGSPNFSNVESSGSSASTYPNIEAPGPSFGMSALPDSISPDSLFPPQKEKKKKSYEMTGPPEPDDVAEPVATQQQRYDPYQRKEKKQEGGSQQQSNPETGDSYLDSLMRRHEETLESNKKGRIWDDLAIMFANLSGDPKIIESTWAQKKSRYEDVMDLEKTISGRRDELLETEKFKQQAAMQMQQQAMQQQKIKNDMMTQMAEWAPYFQGPMEDLQAIVEDSDTAALISRLKMDTPLDMLRAKAGIEEQSNVNQFNRESKLKYGLSGQEHAFQREQQTERLASEERQAGIRSGGKVNGGKTLTLAEVSKETKNIEAAIMGGNKNQARKELLMMESSISKETDVDQDAIDHINRLRMIVGMNPLE